MNNKNILVVLLAGLILLYQVVRPYTTVSAAELIPPPPDFYTCHATGNGTVCQGKIVNQYTGGMDGSCLQGFDILENGYFEETATRYYDLNGYLVVRVLHVIYSGSDARNVLYNWRTGKSLTYTSDVTETDSFTVPGDFNSISARFTGNLYMVTLPGTGMIVQDVRALTFAPPGDILDVRGPKVLSSGEMEKLCEALQ